MNGVGKKQMDIISENTASSCFEFERHFIRHSLDYVKFIQSQKTIIYLKKNFAFIIYEN